MTRSNLPEITMVFSIFALALVALFLFWGPTQGSQRDVDYIGEVGQRAIAASQEGDVVAYEEAKAELYATSQDPDVPVACQRYADANLITLVLIDTVDLYPDSQELDFLLSYFLANTPERAATLAIFRNECLLAI